MAWSSPPTIPWSFSTRIWRDSRLLMVGSSAGDAARLLPTPEHAPRLPQMRSTSRLRLGCMVRIPRLIGSVVQLCDRKARLSGVSGKTFLLLFEFGDGEFLHHLLLLLAECGHPRNQRLDAAVEIDDALREDFVPRGLVLLRLRERGIATLGVGQAGVDGLERFLRRP